MAFRHPETWLHRPYQSRFLRRPEGRLRVLRAIHLLKTPLKRHSKSVFSMHGDDFAWPLVTLKHRFLRRLESRL
jgi:hypothetical protein